MPPSRRAALAVAVAAGAVLLLVVVAPGAAAHAADPDGWAPARAAAACAAGTVGECAARRELWSGGYISYDAMSRGRVPCSYRGASYYNCRPGGPANPYSRGCSQITRCRG
ncbi:unnamed protein product [Urochloa decumbens]|uniref:Uncharacterized protein n=1 Tax=Urochloa decumbens TaxID=240449 RepID=A0ABC8YN41_9POAL